MKCSNAKLLAFAVDQWHRAHFTAHVCVCACVCVFVCVPEVVQSSDIESHTVIGIVNANFVFNDTRWDVTAVDNGGGRSWEDTLNNWKCVSDTYKDTMLGENNMCRLVVYIEKNSMHSKILAKMMLVRECLNTCWEKPQWPSICWHGAILQIMFYFFNGKYYISTTPFHFHILRSAHVFVCVFDQCSFEQFILYSITENKSKQICNCCVWTLNTHRVENLRRYSKNKKEVSMQWNAYKECLF